jgi:hypothetical protein
LPGQPQRIEDRLCPPMALPRGVRDRPVVAGFGRTGAIFLNHGKIHLLCAKSLFEPAPELAVALGFAGDNIAQLGQSFSDAHDGSTTSITSLARAM